MVIRPREIKGDTRFEYYAALTHALMDITVESHGPYDWQPWDKEVSPERQKEMLRIGQALNVIYTARKPGFYSVAMPVKYHVRKGINGYRLLLINKSDQPRFKSITSIKGLKKLTVGQARGWPDASIYRENGFGILDSGNYGQLLSMLRAKRFDYYALGISEAPEVLWDCDEACTDIMIEESIILHYPFPIFLYVSKQAPKLHERLEFGMEKMLKSGAFETLWQKHHGKYVNNLDLPNRKIFKLKNPNIPDFTIMNRPELWLNLQDN